MRDAPGSGERLLSSVVDAAGDVDYRALASDELDDALDAVAAADLGSMEGNTRYAFLINAYNVTVVDAVRRVLWRGGEQVKSLKNPFPWLRFFLFTGVRVGGRRLSLFRLEYQSIRPFLREDPRGHFALVCASTGCPPLRDGLFHGDALDEELEMAGQAFLRPGGGYRLDREAGVLWLNRILKWYRRDFRAMGGLRAVCRRHAEEDDAAWEKENRPRIRSMRYDWDLNVAGAT